jgi:alcohol dehydrogenase class IV
VRAFTYNALPVRVIFGVGSLAQLPAELERLGAKRALLLSTPEQSEAVRQVAAALSAASGMNAIALGSAGMALHHKLCHTLGGTWNLPHAETHAIVLPHAARYNRDAAPEAMARIARALGAQDAPTGPYDLEVRLGLKISSPTSA